jgi:demethylmenaquinone methyltransferase/2-methoxy-6-polyprenyl-1,4-benzoquinol methylase
VTTPADLQDTVTADQLPPTPAATETLVHLPHAPLPAYYTNGDGDQRERFLRATFDNTAVDYNRLERLLGLGSGSRYRRDALQRAGLTPGMQVVDVGMGTGLVAREILNITGQPDALVGVDPSAGMMAQATLPAGVRCLLGRAEAIPLPDASADFIVMGYALRHIADLAAAFTEFRRVLRPGGRLLIMEITKPQSRVGYLLLKGYMRGVVPLLARLVARSSETPMLWRYYWDTIEAVVPPAQVMATLSASGLLEVRREVALGIFSEYLARG